MFLSTIPKACEDFQSPDLHNECFFDLLQEKSKIMKKRISAGLAFNNLVRTLCLALVKLHFAAHNLVI